VTNNLKEVVKEAKEHFIVNGETYICWNSERGYFYCNSKDLQTINIRDSFRCLNPLVIGHWDHALTTINKEGKIFRTGIKYYELNKIH